MKNTFLKKITTVLLALCLVLSPVSAGGSFAENGKAQNAAAEPASVSPAAGSQTEEMTGGNSSPETKAAENGTAETKTPENSTTANNTPESGTAENKTPENGTAENKTPESGTAENKTPENGTTENKTPENSTSENKTPENKTSENGTQENKTPENSTPENKTPENGTTENKTPENSTSENKTPENSTPENKTPENSTPENKTPENGTDENKTPEDPGAEDPKQENPGSKEPGTEDPETEEPEDQEPEVSREELDAVFNSSLKAFPESYHSQLKALHEKYPKWIFYPAQTNLKWDEAVSSEGALGRSLVHTSSISSWKSTQQGAYNWNSSTWYGLDQSTYVQASEGIIAHCMDPRNYLTDDMVFAFLDYSYEEDGQTLSGLKRIIKGTFLEGSYTEGGKEIPYTETVMKAAAKSKINPYVLAVTMILEMGSKGASSSMSGTVAGYEGLYNYFNIGAYTDSTRSAIQRGLWWAGGTPSSGKTSTSYGRPWNTRTKAIMGGAEFYSENYVSAGQNTLYFKKWNVLGSNPYTHQYMTNVQGAMSEGKVFSKAYSEESRNSSLIFCIPVYSGMPAEAVKAPTGDGSPNYKLDSLSVEGFEISPDFKTDKLEYSLVVPSDTGSVTIKAVPKDSKAKVKGTGAFTVSAGETRVFEIKVTAQNGDERIYKLSLAVEGRASKPKQDSKVSIDTGYKISDGVLSGLAPSTDASTFIKNIKISNGSASLCSSSGESYSGKVGTGCVLKIYNADGSENASYSIVLYGDANGDGKISSLDLLVIQKSIIGKTKALEGVYRQAADADRSGKVASVDLLKIQKSIIGIKELDQK